MREARPALKNLQDGLAELRIAGIQRGLCEGDRPHKTASATSCNAGASFM
jgi:hypothetical protein